MKQSFSELDLWLIKNWARAHEMEDSMNRVREKYAEVLERTVKRVQEEFPELERAESKSDRIGFGKRSWPTEWNSWPTGFWIEYISLDDLLVDGGNDAVGSIWLGIPRSVRNLPDKVKAKISKIAGKLLKPEKLRWSVDDQEDLRTCLWYPLPESRRSLVEMALDAKGERFAECIAKHVHILHRFAPVLNETLQKSRAK